VTLIILMLAFALLALASGLCLFLAALDRSQGQLSFAGVFVTALLSLVLCAFMHSIWWAVPAALQWLYFIKRYKVAL